MCYRIIASTVIEVFYDFPVEEVGVEPTGPESNGFTDRPRTLRDYSSYCADILSGLFTPRRSGFTLGLLLMNWGHSPLPQRKVERVLKHPHLYHVFLSHEKTRYL